eukprot:TRINITY_DN808_c0_g2_i2.p1 TRINITY_DN808_c0_g2~~TRINITY_DN808_c0_g2_i2.p1  ORF type:complete len:166 (+),score=5.71 TRINITY_DN808_c0_g2_i2:465-962(+)
MKDLVPIVPVCAILLIYGVSFFAVPFFVADKSSYATIMTADQFSMGGILIFCGLLGLLSIKNRTLSRLFLHSLITSTVSLFIQTSLTLYLCSHSDTAIFSPVCLTGNVLGPFTRIFLLLGMVAVCSWMIISGVDFMNSGKRRLSQGFIPLYNTVQHHVPFRTYCI